MPRTLLPKNLGNSLRYLPEEDIKRLADAVSTEMKRRGLMSVAQSPAAPKPQARAPRTDETDPILSQLTKSQINLIRSSIQAGVKPAALSRQFGWTRAQITAALASR